MAPARDDDEFVEVERQQATPDLDAEMPDVDTSSSSSGLALQRMSANNIHTLHDDEDESEDNSQLHPLMNRLQNRLLSRNTNLNRASSNKFDTLHPYTSILSLADVDQCVQLEESAFPEHERCSREKVCSPLPVLSCYFYCFCCWSAACHVCIRSQHM